MKRYVVFGYEHFGFKRYGHFRCDKPEYVISGTVWIPDDAKDANCIVYFLDDNSGRVESSTFAAFRKRFCPGYIPSFSRFAYRLPLC